MGDITALTTLGKNVPAQGGMLEVATARAAQEVQAMMVIAKRFPRDEEQAYNRIMTACQRKSLAEVAQYAFPKGGQTVEGPSIRLAETIARAWGNMQFGVTELEQRNGESTMEAFAWDLETNTRAIRIFVVRHERKSKGQIKSLEDPRDVYELTANTGARRLRACILELIPADVVEAAVEQCDKTLKTGNSEPIIDRVRKMIVAFGPLGVTQSMIEKRLGHNLDATTETEIVGLKKVYTSLRDNMASREQFFDGVSGGKASTQTEPPSEEENMKRVEMSEALRCQWEAAGLSIPDQVKAIVSAGGKPTPGEGGRPDLFCLDSSILSMLLAGGKA